MFHMATDVAMFHYRLSPQKVKMPHQPKAVSKAVRQLDLSLTNTQHHTALAKNTLV